MATIADARVKGNILLCARPSGEGEPSKTGSSGDTRYHIWQLMFDDLQTMKWTKRLEQLKEDADKSPGSRVLTSAGRYFINTSALEKALSQQVGSSPQPFPFRPLSPARLLVDPSVGGVLRISSRRPVSRTRNFEPTAIGSSTVDSPASKGQRMSFAAQCARAKQMGRSSGRNR